MMNSTVEQYWLYLLRCSKALRYRACTDANIVTDKSRVFAFHKQLTLFQLLLAQRLHEKHPIYYSI